MSLTLKTYFDCIAHFWKISLIATVLCGVCFGCSALLMEPTFEASSTITATDSAGRVPASSLLALANGFAEDTAASMTGDDDHLRVECEIGSGSIVQPLTITVEGSNPDSCVSIANDIARDSVEQATKKLRAFQDLIESDSLELSALNTSDDVAEVLSGTILQESLTGNLDFSFCSFFVVEASSADKLSSGPLRLTALGLLFGFVLSSTAIALVCIIRNPVINAESISRVSKAPILNPFWRENPWPQAKQNISILSKGYDRICVVAADENAERCCQREKDDLVSALACGPDRPELPVECSGEHTTVFFDVASGASDALLGEPATDAAIIVLTTWKCSVDKVGEILAELDLVGSKVLGFVLLA